MKADTENLVLNYSNALEKQKSQPRIHFDKEGRYPTFNHQEIKVGRILGRGGFCTVDEITRFSLQSDFIDVNPASEEEDTTSREDLCSSYLNEKGHSNYAMKRLSPDTIKDKELARQGMIDLTLERKFLSILDHPHIIKLRGVAANHSSDNDYFIILDRLYDTLEKRLKTWKSTEKSLSSVYSKFGSKGKSKLTAFKVDKLKCIYGVTSAMTFMHKNDIIYRDLKPENIGFDVMDKPRIYDFGFARLLDSSDVGRDGNYTLTGFTGSPCYMAPEVALMKPYNLSADVYSFGIMLWKLCSYDVVFKNYNMKMLQDHVWKKGYRPKINPKWSSFLKDLMTKCWDEDATKRPDFKTILEMLQNEINACS